MKIVRQLVLLACVGAAAAVEHPFILWTKEEAAALKQRIETDADAKAQLARMQSIESKSGKAGGNGTMLNLFRAGVLGDEKAAESELKQLLGFIGKVPEPMTKEFQEAMAGRGDAAFVRGMASFGDRHMRDEQTLNTLRYDVLYDRLTPEQRAGVETAMKSYIQFHLDGHKPWHPDFRYGKMSWLPNMSWPRTIGTHLMAAALRDESLVQKMFASEGGWKWFFDGYVSDGRFYNEEFAKYYSNIGTMLMWCEALERLGLGKYGYGYTGTGGATMRSFLEMYFWIGYPRTDIPGGMPNLRRVSMGDARGAPWKMDGVGDHSVVMGYLPDGTTGGDVWWTSANMNGPLPKMAQPLWYEIGHRRWPDAGFGWFLAQMRAPGQDRYLPSLYFGLKPIAPGEVKPPPAPSYVAMQRGFAFLRAEESPAYWESPAPAVALQFGMYYAHYAHDCFSLLGLHAFNRAIYVNAWGSGKVDHPVNQQILSGPPSGYIARHPWKDTVRGHCGVVVDNLQARPVNDGENGLEKHRIRQDFAGAAKFVAGRARNVYPDVDQERALLLTREYLADVSWLSSPRQRRYEWMVHGAGAHVPEEGWTPTTELNGSMLYREIGEPQPGDQGEKLDGNDLADVRKLTPGDKGWTATILQSFQGADPAKSKLGKAWYERGVGVRVAMPGVAGTTVFAGRPPGSAGAEQGGATLMVRRESPAAIFAAIHEPFAGGVGAHAIAAVERIQETLTAVGLRVQAKGFSDRVLIALGDRAEEPQTLGDGKESFTFAGHGFVRVVGGKVLVQGGVREFAIAVPGPVAVVVDGKESAGEAQDGLLRWKR